MPESTATIASRPRRASSIEKRRNAAIELAESIRPITATDPCALLLLPLANVTTAAQFCAMSAECKKHEHLLNRTAHILVLEEGVEREFRMIALGSRAPVSPKQITGLCWVDVRGKTAMLVPENTLVYWK